MLECILLMLIVAAESGLLLLWHARYAGDHLCWLITDERAAAAGHMKQS
jgi:hypothetical protein